MPTDGRFGFNSAFKGLRSVLAIIVAEKKELVLYILSLSL
jgi:hypothetical protein